MIVYDTYSGEHQLQHIIDLISRDLSEPYSVYTYRYFLYNWPNLCHIALIDNKIIGVILGKLEDSKLGGKRGYIAMLAVEKQYRGLSIGKALATSLLTEFLNEGVEEISLETECSNKAALSLYSKLGFIRDKRLPRYYLNGSDAFRLKYWACTFDKDALDASSNSLIV